jgi:hypothetical protein
MDNVEAQQPMTTTEEMILLEKVQKHMDAIPIFHINPEEKNGENDSKLVIRGMFEPFVLSLAGTNNVDLSTLQTPEAIIKAYMSTPGLELNEELQTQLQKYLEHPESEGEAVAINWFEEALKVSMEPDNHPIYALSRKAVGSLTPDARTVLTRLSWYR